MNRSRMNVRNIKFKGQTEHLHRAVQRKEN